MDKILSQWLDENRAVLCKTGNDRGRTNGCKNLEEKSKKSYKEVRRSHVAIQYIDYFIGLQFCLIKIHDYILYFMRAFFHHA
jgi:hypothetical protein